MLSETVKVIETFVTEYNLQCANKKIKCIKKKSKKPNSDEEEEEEEDNSDSAYDDSAYVPDSEFLDSDLSDTGSEVIPVTPIFRRNAACQAKMETKAQNALQSELAASSIPTETKLVSASNTEQAASKEESTDTKPPNALKTDQAAPKKNLLKPNQYRTKSHTASAYFASNTSQNFQLI